MSSPSNDAFPRWLLLFLAAALLAIGIGGISFYRYQERQQRQHTEDELQAIANLKTAQISNWRKDQLFDASVFQQDFALYKSAERFLAVPNDDNRNDIRLRLHNLAIQHDYYDIQLADPTGKIKLSLSGDSEECEQSAQALATAIRERKLAIADFHRDPHTSAIHLSWVAPFLSSQNQVFGILILVDDAEAAILASLQSWPVPSRTAETLLVRRDGDHVLYLNNLRHRKNAALSLRVPLNRTDMPAVMAVLGNRGFVHGKDYRGVEVVAFIQGIPDSPWFMETKIDEDEAFAAWRFRSGMILTLIGALIGAALLSGIAFWQLEKNRHYRSLFKSEALRRADAERHRITLHSIGDAVISTDESGRVAMMNPAAEMLSGWSIQEAYEKPIEEIFRIVNEQTGAPAENPAAIVLREGKPAELAGNSLLVTKNGLHRPISDSGAPIRGESGKIIGAVLVFRDQTSERASLRAQLESQNRIRATLDQMMEGCQIIGHDGRFVYINDAAETHLRKRREDLIGKAIQEVWQGGEDVRVLEHVRRCLKEQAIVHVEHRDTLSDGSTQWLDLRIQPVPDGLMLLSQDITERKQAESLRRQLSDILDKSVNEVFIFDPQTLKFLHVNQGALTNLKYTLEEIRELTPVDLKPDFTEEGFRRLIQPLLDNEQESLAFETVHRRADGSHYPVEVHLQIIDAEYDRVFLAFIFDITKRKLTESEREQLMAQLIQAQKMESIGRLAGGIAHDFNNLLSIILGYGEIMLEQMRMDHPHRQSMQEIHAAALRAKELTRQLLAFSRKQILEFSPVDVDDVVTGFVRLLNRLLGEDIELALELSGEPLCIVGDAAQLEQVLMNLAINARDAMADGGKLTIKTGKVSLQDVPIGGEPGLRAGDYARITISDTGCGMDPETLIHVFEPFFTTKEKEKGTGLGLATSYGIITQHSGDIQVFSEPGQGTTFMIYLPINNESIQVEIEPAKMREIVSNNLTILLIEDDEQLRKLALVILTRIGYSVIESHSVEDAIRKAAACKTPIHLVLTDVVMPRMKGPEVFAKVAEHHPESRVLYMSGYTDDIISRQGILPKGIQFIQKPFATADLLEKIEQILNG
jgi:two-component system, cell cycle sensor histidine kinase and response regulator CckA